MLSWLVSRQSENQWEKSSDWGQRKLFFISGFEASNTIICLLETSHHWASWFNTEDFEKTLKFLDWHSASQKYHKREWRKYSGAGSWCWRRRKSWSKISQRSSKKKVQVQDLLCIEKKTELLDPGANDGGSPEVKEGPSIRSSKINPSLNTWPSS